MKLARTGIITAAVLAVASVAFAQKPDFSGTWTPDTSAMTPPATGTTGGGGRGGRGMMMAGPMAVKIAGDTLTIERTIGENKIVSTYNLDGTESVNKQMMRGAEMETKAIAKWDGDKLVITEKREGQGGNIIETTQTWSLEGGNLVIERTGGRAAGKTVYKKTT
jgi:hypothetical protein